MVDANAAYHLTDAAHLAELDRFDLMMIEQPLDYDDIRDHARLQERIRTPICLDESLHTVRGRGGRHRRSAPAASSTSSRGGSAATANRSGCTTSRPATASRCGTAACSKAASAARTIFICPRSPGFTLPGDVAASRRYFAPDLIDPEIEVRPDGTIAVPTGPASA